mgnify:CR=1 FL=1|tara:strand:- start:7734 stop:8069 length:336 start_codon:yes stop_codon:yes gene_type:complete
MNPGEFRHKTTIKVITDTQQTDYGDYTQTSVANVDRYAKIKWLPGSEKIEAETITFQKNIELIYRFESVTEYLDIIDVISYDNNDYKINSIQFKGHANQQYVLINASTFTD